MPDSLSCKDSPMQNRIRKLACCAFSTFAAVSARVSPYLARRSEWPIRVHPYPHSIAISAVHSPVNAPVPVADMFCVLTSMPQLENASITAPPCKAVGQITTSHFEVSNLKSLKASHNFVTSAMLVGLLFQLPPTIFFLAEALAASRAATPGNSLPSRSSKEAPPPVLQWVTFCSVPYFLQAVAVSPPPMMVMVPACVTFTISSMRLLVPASNFAISKTPMGPFQMMVLADCTAAAFLLMDSGPQSRPMKPAGTPVEVSALLISPSSPNLEEHTKSTGRTISTPAALAVSIISGTILAPSSSKREPPISMLLITLRKVKAIPPPMIILFTFEHKFLISWILSLTFAPPKMASTGLAGLSKTLAKAESSACMRKPEHLTSKPSPTIEL
mmetsp:Transcript_7423/g.16344  ORF Transcript_7423/g.16344 Transcript_7423/m.16344 type:complete len:387 (-) Transcript_7423:608-1768(-)